MCFFIRFFSRCGNRFGGFDERRQKQQQQHQLLHLHQAANQQPPPQPPPTTHPPGNWHDAIISTINNTTISLHNRDNQEKRDSCSWGETDSSITSSNSNNTLSVNTNAANSNR